MKPAGFHIGIYSIAMMIIALVGISYICPEQLWSLHALSLLPSSLQVLFWAAALACLTLPLWVDRSRINNADQIGWKVKLSVAGILAMLALAFPIHTDQYGDSRFILKAVDFTITEWDIYLLLEPLTPDFFNTKVGVHTFYELNNLFTWLSGAKGSTVTPILEALFLVITSLVWMWFTALFLKDEFVRWIFNLGLFSAPVMAVYLGHFETYYLSYSAIVVWFALLGKTIRSKSVRWLFGLTAFFPFLIQTHITNWILLPSLIFSWYYLKPNAILFRPKFLLDNFLKGRFSWYKGGHSWSALTTQIVIPALLLLTVAYFGIWENHNGPRQFSLDEFEDTLFLPLYTNESPPYDRYNLFSTNHLLDYANLILMWSPTLLLLLGSVVIFRKQINWNNPLTTISGSTFVVCLILFFMFNPLLAASQDWDLFILPGMILFPTLVFVFSELKVAGIGKQLIGPILALVIITVPFHVVNANGDMLSNHYRIIGIHDFKTYWIGSSTTLITSANMKPTPQSEIEFLDDIVNELAPFAVENNDKEYANLLSELGVLKRKNDDLSGAIELFREAVPFSPNLGTNLYWLSISEFEAHNYDASQQIAERLVELKYQPFERTVRMAIHTSLAAKNYQRAADFSVTYLNRWPDNEVIAEIEYRLRSGQEIETLIALFEDK